MKTLAKTENKDMEVSKSPENQKPKELFLFRFFCHFYKNFVDLCKRQDKIRTLKNIINLNIRIMKQLLLILSGILFLCSCSSDYEKIAQGKLEKLEGNTATVSVPSSQVKVYVNEQKMPVNENLVFNLANDKDVFWDIPLTIGQDVFVYNIGGEVLLSQANQDIVNDLTRNDVTTAILCFVMSGFILLLGIGFTGETGESKDVFQIVIFALGLLLSVGFNWWISSIPANQYIIKDCGKLILHNDNIVILKTEQGNKTYEGNIRSIDVKSEPNSLQETSDDYALLEDKAWQKSAKYLVSCNNQEILKKTLTKVNEENVQSHRYGKIGIWGVNTFYIIIYLSLLWYVYQIAICDFFHKLFKKKKKEFKENISEDERHGKGSF